jgi:hypothetical protein
LKHFFSRGMKVPGCCGARKSSIFGILAPRRHSSIGLGVPCVGYMSSRMWVGLRDLRAGGFVGSLLLWVWSWSRSESSFPRFWRSCWISETWRFGFLGEGKNSYDDLPLPSFLDSALPYVAFFGGIFIFVGDLNQLSIFTKTNCQLFQEFRRPGKL